MLIDLSPPSHLDSLEAIKANGNGGSNLSSSLNMSSILDAPIDIPTEDTGNDLASADIFGGAETNKLEPPPYQSPPTYMNTYALTQQANYAVSTYREYNGISRPKATDPFDTSHIAEESNQLYVNHTSMSASGSGQKTTNASNYSMDSLKHSNKNNISKLCYPYGIVPGQEPGKAPLNNSQFDDLVLNTMASLSPKSSHTSLTFANGSSKQSNVSPWQPNPLQTTINGAINDTIDLNNASFESVEGSSISQFAAANESLSDSMKVNLSSLTLNDIDDDSGHNSSYSSSNNSVPVAKKFDKAFLAELEKEIYKSDASASSFKANTSQTYAHQSNAKENSVSSIPNEIYGRTGISATLNRLHNDTLSPAHSAMGSASSPATPKFTNTLTKSINQDVASMKLNYTSSPNSSRNYSSLPLNTTNALHLNKKLNYDNQGSSSTSSIENDTASTLNQIWMDHQLQTGSTKNTVDESNATSIYSNSPAGSQSTYGNSAVDKKHNFVAVSNRQSTATLPPPPAKQNHSNRASVNIYNTVPSDIYGSVTGGNVYDVVANSTSGSTYYGMVPGSGSNAIDYYEAILPNESQSVIYDEVAGEELLRPHRPAPLAPPVLSAQQIQRRMQKQIYGNLGGTGSPGALYGTVEAATGGAESNQQKIFALIKEIGGDGDATELEATQALQAVNWDHGLAVRHFKVERLFK